MLKIQLLEKYKSLVPPFDELLPDFTIITGINGVGKSHLLTGLLKEKFLVNDNGKDLIESNYFDCLYIPAEDLMPKENNSLSVGEIDKKINEMWRTYEKYLDKGRSEATKLEYFFKNTSDMWKVEEIAKRSNKNINQLQYNDFKNQFILDVTNYSPFIHAFSFHFKWYYDLWENNQYRQFLNLQKGMPEVNYLNDDEFIKTYGEKPWVFINEILEKVKFPYRLTYPLNFVRGEDFGIELLNADTKTQIKFNELSSGERVLMSLVVAIYNANSKGEFPKVLLLDEPDAYLHPSLIKTFLDIVENVFVNEKKIKVIMTTHSPSTVALCSESNLFVMNRIGKRLQKITKDKALKILTEGVPALSINYENRRQIFVESKNDVFFYESIYQKVRKRLDSDVSLNFIPAGAGESGGCDQVKEVVNLLNRYGNKFIFGIIDWDKKNVSSQCIKVLGKQERYSIENYIFDPIILSAFLLREKILNRKDLSLNDDENYNDLKYFDNQRLQRTSDLLIALIGSNLSLVDLERKVIRYLNGREVSIPLWYLQFNGHELEALLKNIFPPIKKYKGEGDLKKEVIVKVIDDLPELIPQSIFDMFKEIQES